MSKKDTGIAKEKTEKITDSQYAAKQAEIVARMIQAGTLPSLEQVQAAVAVARENLKKKLNFEDSSRTRPDQGDE